MKPEELIRSEIGTVEREIVDLKDKVAEKEARLKALTKSLELLTGERGPVARAAENSNIIVSSRGGLAGGIRRDVLIKLYEHFRTKEFSVGEVAMWLKDIFPKATEATLKTYAQSYCKWMRDNGKAEYVGEIEAKKGHKIWLHRLLIMQTPPNTPAPAVDVEQERRLREGVYDS